jgi:hypothetical protein
MTAVAHSFDDEPDPAEAMPAADFEVIRRAHEICCHPAAVEVLSNAQHVALLPHAIKILRSQIRAAELVAEMQARGENRSEYLFSLEDFKFDNLSDLELPVSDFKYANFANLDLPVSAPDESVIDWQQVAEAAWHDEGWALAATEYQVNRRNAYAWVRR